jgi:hypothetical protein
VESSHQLLDQCKHVEVNNKYFFQLDYQTVCVLSGSYCYHIASYSSSIYWVVHDAELLFHLQFFCTQWVNERGGARTRRRLKCIQYVQRIVQPDLL